MLNRPEFENIVKEKLMFRGDQKRYYLFYKNSGRIDLEDAFEYRFWEREYHMEYNLNFAAGIFNTDDSLWVPLGSKSHEIDMATIKLNGDKAKIFYNTPKPEGWFAWYDKQEKSGLAVFFPSSKIVNSIIYSGNPGASLNNKNGNPCAKIKMDVPPNPSGLYSIRISFYAFDTPNELASLYKLWKGQDIGYGYVEEK